MLNIAAQWKSSAQAGNLHRWWKGLQRLQACLSRGTLATFGARFLQCHFLGHEPEWGLPHGLRRCNRKQAGLFPNRGLGSHDLSEQLSPEVLPRIPTHWCAHSIAPGAQGRTTNICKCMCDLSNRSYICHDVTRVVLLTFWHLMISLDVLFWQFH